MSTKKTVEDEKLLDSRCVDRYIARGYITRDQVETHIKGLSDHADDAKLVEISQDAFLEERVDFRQQLESRERARAAREAELALAAAAAAAAARDEYGEEDET